MPPTSAARTTRGTRISHRIASSVGLSEVSNPGTCSRAAADSRIAPIPRSIGPASTPTTSDDEQESDRGARPDGRQPARTDVRRRAPPTTVTALSRSRASAEDIARKKFTSRGPQRDAIESSTRTIEPVRTALIAIPARPRRDGGRLLAAADGVREHDEVGARRRRRTRPRAADTPMPAPSAASAMFSSPSAAYTLPDERLRGRRSRGRVSSWKTDRPCDPVRDDLHDRGDPRLHAARRASRARRSR